MDYGRGSGVFPNKESFRHGPLPRAPETGMNGSEVRAVPHELMPYWGMTPPPTIEGYTETNLPVGHPHAPGYRQRVLMML